LIKQKGVQINQELPLRLMLYRPQPREVVDAESDEGFPPELALPFRRKRQ